MVLGSGRAKAALAVLIVVVLGGCVSPKKLDEQEQVAFARACASLIERNLANDHPPIGTLSGQTLDLTDGESFYRTLGSLRPPSFFDFHDPNAVAKSPKDKLDQCEARAKPSSSSKSSTP